MALTRSRNTPRLATGVNFAALALAVAATTKLFQGGIVCKNAAGNAVKGSATAGLIAVGIALEEADNTTGAAGDKTVQAQPGCYKLANSAGADEITAADIGKACYIVDDETVAKTSDAEARPPAGIVVAIDTDGAPFVAIGLTESAIAALRIDTTVVA